MCFFWTNPSDFCWSLELGPDWCSEKKSKSTEQCKNPGLEGHYNKLLKMKLSGFPMVYINTVAILSLDSLLDCFQKAARHAFSRKLCRFKLQPKSHMVGEIKYKLVCDRRKGCKSLNPIAFATQLDEDFAGRLCAFSRVVSSRTMAAKVIERYKIALMSAWWGKSQGRWCGQNLSIYKKAKVITWIRIKARSTTITSDLLYQSLGLPGTELCSDYFINHSKDSLCKNKTGFPMESI